MNLLITGGCGFIGSNLIKYILENTEHSVFNIDKLTYAGHERNHRNHLYNPRYFFEKVDICDPEKVDKVFESFKPDAVMHLAAESHVDRSIDSSSIFLATNIVGTHILLEAVREYNKKKNIKFILVSTDEVYGSLNLNDPPFSEKNQYQPNSPYSASKAAADHLVRAWHKTYGLETVITHCSNNYGIQQLPEKLIPNTIFKAFDRKTIPVYGTGENVRDWIHVDDHCRALLIVLEKGIPGEVYDVGADNEWSNIVLVRKICDMVDELVKNKERLNTESLKTGDSRQSLIEFVTDRKGHDMRYAIDSSKIRNELGWKPMVDFEKGLRDTVIWYLNHRNWWL